MRRSHIESLYRILESSSVEVTSIEWPELRSLTRSLNRAYRQSREAGATSDLESLLTRTRAAHRLLTRAASAQASDRDSLEVLALEFQLHLESGRDSHIGQTLEGIIHSLVALANEPHPVAPLLEGIISRYGTDVATGGAEVAVVVDRQDAQLTVDWLNEVELSAQVVTPSELRRSGPLEGVILLGPPGRYFVSQWADFAAAERLGGWMIASPPARSVHVMLWDGQREFRLKPCQLFSASLPIPATIVEAPQAEPPDEPIVWTWFEPSPSRTTFDTSAWSSDSQTVDAIAVRLTNDDVAFFSNDVGAQPRRVEVDGDEVEFETTSSASLTPGTILIFNSQRAAESLRADANQEMERRFGGSASTMTRSYQQELKDAVARAESQATLIHELGKLVNDRTYARGLINRVQDEEFIAPQRPGAYPALRDVLGLDPDDGSRYELLRALRVEHQRAGQRLSRIQRDSMIRDTSWQIALQEAGCVTLEADDGSGSFELRIVIERENEIRQVGRSRLGRLIALRELSPRQGQQ